MAAYQDSAAWGRWQLVPADIQVNPTTLVLPSCLLATAMESAGPFVRGRRELLASGCNTHSHCMVWGRSQVQEDEHEELEVVAYASHSWIALATAEGRVTRNLVGHTDRVLCVAWLEAAKELVSGSADGTVRIWARRQAGWQMVHTLRPCPSEKEGLLGVTQVAAIVEGPVRLVAASTAKGVAVWHEGEDGQWSQVLWSAMPATQMPQCLALVALGGPSHFALFVGALDARVHVWSGAVPSAAASSPSAWSWAKAGALSGHQDWVRTLDYALAPSSSSGGDGAAAGCLASGAQDCKIRIWKIRRLQERPSVQSECNGGGAGVVEARRVEEGADGDDEDDEDDEEEALRPEDEDHELRLVLEGASPSCPRFGISLDALLVGHEDWVTGVRWRPAPTSCSAEEGEEEGGMVLLSSSMDRSLIMWRPEDGTSGTGVWVPHVRLGDVGSDIGGPIGGNLLGFVGCDFSPTGSTVLAYGFGGSFHAYKAEGSRWRPIAFSSGHFGEVSDVQWEPRGRYLVSVSKDQTARLFCRCLRTGRYHEMSRVQVHGYDLTCVDLLASMEHRLVSGADEKTMRVFDATNKVLGLLEELCGVRSTSPARVETAYVPALGLSNKAVTLRREGEEEEGGGDGGMRTGKQQQGGGGDNDDGEAISKARMRVSWRGPPLEQELVDHTLWPEVQKLYGHGNGVTCLAVNHAGTLMASACKAREAQSAGVRLWDTATWRGAGVLAGHQSTVVQLAFSHDDSLLVSVSRDRQICLFARTGGSEGFRLVKMYPKAHKRIIWSCSWSHDDALLATGSRDGTVKLWRRISSSTSDADPHSLLQEAASFEPLTGSSGGEGGSSAVTAVAFLPRPPVFATDLYVLAIGLECGEIELWVGGVGEQQPWRPLGTLLDSSAHAATVRRLRWRPRQMAVKGEVGDGDAWPTELASCSSDHAVRVTLVDGI